MKIIPFIAEDELEKLCAPYLEERRRSMEELLNGVPPSGGHCDRQILERLVMAAFNGGIAAVLLTTSP